MKPNQLVVFLLILTTTWFTLVCGAALLLSLEDITPVVSELNVQKRVMKPGPGQMNVKQQGYIL
ncbi:hypothetical protein [Pseudomonas fluorescens]|uniref:hypothetical protein n=1 Tax=Pseudomonas fluorescens TaxID=294 RepID=UPI0012428022|nr:hypothetical protein [Pseudomonas fluorescens]